MYDVVHYFRVVDFTVLLLFITNSGSSLSNDMCHFWNGPFGTIYAFSAALEK